MSTTPATVPIAPAPWQLKGIGHIFPTHTPFSASPIALPDASHAPLEAASPAGREQAARFHGGVGAVVVVRYSESPVGPYDELIYCPGLFSRPGTPEEYYAAITRIYVSTAASVANGRRNWNIPKHLATFTFAPVSPSKTHLTVSDPDSTPFFQALIRDGARLSPSIPVRTSWLETRLARCICKGRAFEFLQLPLPALEGFELEGQPVQDALKVKPSATSWATVSTLTSVERDEWIGFGDGVGFPRFGVYTGLGARIDFTGAGMSFPLPDVVHAAAE